MRCSTCGAELADDVRGCPVCDADAGESLPVVELDDGELGFRTEDRYAYVPPGPNWIRRRVHDDSTRAPLALVSALVLFFVLAVLVRGAGTNGGNNESSARSEALPRLRGHTGASLLVAGGEGLRVLDVDRRRSGDVSVSALPSGRVTDAIAVGDRSVVVIDHHAYALPPGLRGHAVALGSASDVTASSAQARVWLATYPADGSTAVREVTLDGEATTAPTTIPSGPWTLRATADRYLIVERGGSGQHSIALWDASRPQTTPITLRDDAVFVAASAELVASRPSSCPADQCDLLLDDVRGSQKTFARALPTNAGDAAFTSDAGHLAALDTSNGNGTIIDLRDGTPVLFRTRVPVAGNPALAWSRDGSWLFAVAANEIDAVDLEGRVYVVPTPSPLAATAVLTR